MCAIVGIFGNGSLTSDRMRELAWSMLKRQAHRGPEANRAVVGDCFVMAHGQLSFQAPGINSQPRSSRSRRTLLLFNGEIFNLSELRKRFAEDLKGCSEADSEILVELIDRQGMDVINALKGMFSIVAYDRLRQSFFLARDRLGKKPLFYADLRCGFVFSSELTGIQAAAAEMEGTTSLCGIHAFLRYGFVPSPGSLIDGVLKVEPGEIVSGRPGGVSKKSYWIPRFEPDSSLNAGQIVSRLRHELTNAVKVRLLDPVRYGALVSGGIDSAIVTKLCADVVGGRNLPCFHVTVGDASAGQSVRAASTVCRSIGTTLHHLNLENAGLRDTMVSLLSRMDEPNADWSLLPLYALAKYASSHVKCLLSGDGADDFWLGYHAYFWQRRFGTSKRRALLIQYSRLLQSRAQGFARIRLDRLTRIARAAREEAPELRFLAASGPFDEEVARSLQKTCSRIPANEKIRRHVESAHPSNDIDRLQIGTIRSFLQDGIIQKLDRSSMLNSIEIRSPFLDENIVDLSFSVPTDTKLGCWRLKPLVRKLAKELLTARIAKQKKRSFSYRMGSLLRTGLRPVVEDMLLSSNPLLRDYVEKTAVDTIVGSHLNGQQDCAKEVWALLCLEFWLIRNKALRSSSPDQS